nr:MAG: ORF1 [TTV-like mini virus]
MPPFRRRFYYNRRKTWRRPYYRYRRPRNRFRRYRRTTWVRKRLFKKRLKKLKYIRLKQWQPAKIKKCKIIGFLELFETTFGRVSNNFTAVKESFVPEHQPGGGGWSIQQLSLGNLYVQNIYCMNYWTKSNKGYNLCRFFGTKIHLYRQDNVDWIFCYNLEEPLTVTKYTYASYHPYKMLQYTKRIIVPSYQTAPLKRKKYIKKYIRPPKKLTNSWYFQNHFQNVPLITFFACACDLRHMFIPAQAKNNNVTLWALNTRLFEHPKFQDKLFGTQGFRPDRQGKKSLWGLQHAKQDPTTNQGKDLTLLANTMYNTEGEPLDNKSLTDYNRNSWGNPFYYTYMRNDEPTYLMTTTNSENPIQTMITNKETQLKNISNLARRFEDFVTPVRYNPNKDKGLGNQAYFLRTDRQDINNWDPPDDPELIIANFPLWLMLWGFEDYIEKLKKINNLKENGILVIRSDYFNDTLPAYVLLSDGFVNGDGPYNIGRDELNVYERGHWYPRWEFQKEAIENLLMTGPAVAKPNEGETIQSHFKYQFFFKWGGNPSTMETVYDPNTQPIGPDPNNQLQAYEIINPNESIQNYIYQWDTRRDTLTQAATTRIQQIPFNEQSLLSDGTTTSTDIPLQKTATQTKETQEKEETQLLQQLLNLEQYNQQLLLRFRQLKQLMQNM